MQIFMDESGELGFHPHSSHYYVIACLCTDDSKAIRNRYKAFRGYLINHGWPKGIEPKASRVFNCQRHPGIPNSFEFKTNPSPEIIRFLSELAKKDFVIDAIIIKKKNILERLRSAPFGILHNYFAGRVLIPRILSCSEANLIVDQRSKERHSQNLFNGYIATSIRTKKDIELHIVHGDSQIVNGLGTVDYLSWAIFRKYEFKDNRFFDPIQGKINRLRQWYF